MLRLDYLTLFVRVAASERFSEAAREAGKMRAPGCRKHHER